MRDLNRVVFDLLNVIPEDREDLRAELKKFLDAPNTAENWEYIGDLLFNQVFMDYRPEEDWMLQVDII